MKKIGYSLLACTAFIGTSAFAMTAPSLYFTLGAGYAEQQAMPGADEFANISNVTAGTATSSSTQEMGGRVGIGIDWTTGKYTSAGVELAAALYGSSTYDQDNASLELNYYGTELLGVGRLHLGKMALIGKAGVVNESVHPSKSNFGATGGENIQDDSEVLPEVGAGLGYQVGKHTQLSAMYYHTFGHDVSFDTQSSATNSPSINVIDLEIGYYY